MPRHEFVLPNHSSPTSRVHTETYAPKRPRLAIVGERLQQNHAFPRGQQREEHDSAALDQEPSSTADNPVLSMQEMSKEDHDSVEGPSIMDHEWNILDGNDSDSAASLEEGEPMRPDIVSEEPHPCFGEKTVENNDQILDPTNRMAIDLLNLCHEAKIPLVYYDRFIQAIKKGAERGVNWKKLPSRLRLHRILNKHFPISLPQMIRIPHTHDLVPRFNFMDQLIDLLTSKYFQGPEAVAYCCVNESIDSRFGRYEPPPQEGRAEVTSGTWYSNTYSLLLPDSSDFIDHSTEKSYTNWLIPIIVYNDKTGVSAMEGSYSLEPFMFSLGIIRRAFRENADAWRHFGFIPSFSGSQDEEDDAAGPSRDKKNLLKSHLHSPTNVWKYCLKD